VALATSGGGGIVVRGLKKKFTISEKNEWGMMKKRVVQAVDGLDLTVADKTIFCLLGEPPPLIIIEYI
jgi:ABC-type oligopeptide transport system ATPase subunit